jgi:chromosome segregation ATPase
MAESLFYFLIILLLGSSIIGYVSVYIIDKYNCYIESKRKKEHYQLYMWDEERTEAIERKYKWKNDEIKPRQNEIDNIFKSLKYLTKEKRREEIIRLEEIRIDLYNANMTLQALEKDIAEIREKIKNYIDKYDLEWARKKGWG